MFKIGEFSKLTQVSIRMLRYYDDVGLLKPAEIDKWTGYRLYTSNQVSQLRKILFLRDLDFNVKEILKLLQDSSKENLETEFNKKRVLILENIKKQKAMLENIDRLSSDIKAELTEQGLQVNLKSIPETHVISLRRKIDNHFDENKLWEELKEVANLKTWKIFSSSNYYSIYHDKEFKEGDIDVEICVAVDFIDKDERKIEFKTMPQIEYAASVVISGGFENIQSSYNSLACWLEHHNEYEMIGTSILKTIYGPWDEPNPDQYLMELLIPVKLREII